MGSVLTGAGQRSFAYELRGTAACLIPVEYTWLIVFYVPSAARSFRDGAPHLLSLVKDVKLS